MNKRLLLISIIIFIFALYMQIFSFHQVVPLRKAFSNFPIQWKGWVGKIHYFDSKIIENLRVSEYIFRTYNKKDLNRVSLYVGYYASQKEGAQIHSPKQCLPGGGWFELSEKIRDINIDDIGKISVIEAVYQKGDTREVFIYWYKMKDTIITNEYVLKLYMVINSIKYRRNDAAFIRLSAPVSINEQETIRSIEEFMKDFIPLLKDYLPD